MPTSEAAPMAPRKPLCMLRSSPHVLSSAPLLTPPAPGAASGRGAADAVAPRASGTAADAPQAPETEQIPAQSQAAPLPTEAPPSANSPTGVASTALDQNGGSPVPPLAAEAPAVAPPQGTPAGDGVLGPPRLTAFRSAGRSTWLTGAELRALVLRYHTQDAGAPDGVGPEAAALLAGALETSTWGARATHFAAICSFLQARRRDFPLTERGLVAFVGYLYHCLLTRSGPQLRGVSLPGYLSGIRSVHAALGLGELPTESRSLLLAAAVGGYRKAADIAVPPTHVRVGIPVHVLYTIMQLATGPSADRRCKRDAALLLTVVVFGLRPAEAEGVCPAHILELSTSRCELLIAHLKGLTVEQALRRGGRTFYAPAPVLGKPITVLSLLAEWRDLRSSAAQRWFDHPCLPAASLDFAVKSLTCAVGYAPPARCAVNGHSARITAFSQAVLLSWSELRLQIRFDWQRVEDMAGVSLDHRVRVSAASRIFFDPSLPEPRDDLAAAGPDRPAAAFSPSAASRSSPGPAVDGTGT